MEEKIELLTQQNKNLVEKNIEVTKLGDIQKEKVETFKSKDWLIDVAKNVERNTKMFNKQLKQCEEKLNKKGFFGLL